MPLSEIQQKKIEKVVRQILSSRLTSFPEGSGTNRNAPFHDAFLVAFREKLEQVIKVDTPHLVAIASWMHGLNTTLGQTFFESSAHILSGGSKRKFTNVQVTLQQVSAINHIIEGMEVNRWTPDVDKENDLIAAQAEEGEITEVEIAFTADTYREEGNLIQAIELKTVRPNKGGSKAEKRKMLYAKAALMRRHPDKQVKFHTGFPFDPTATTATGYDKQRFINNLIDFKKFYDPNEVLIASELWDYLSGQSNTMEQMLDVVAKTVKDFKEQQRRIVP